MAQDGDEMQDTILTQPTGCADGSDCRIEK